MPLAFAMPLFIGGLALLAAPWLIHQIRRPEREPTRFSSLMFVPEAKRELIERRRIQHILLMLLRMAMLAALALAFARPYWVERGAAVGANEGDIWRIVLLDVSRSMNVDGVFDEAKERARNVIATANPGDRVGVVVFAESSRVVAPLTADPSQALLAIDGATLTYEATDYAAALQSARATLGEAAKQSDISRNSDTSRNSDASTRRFVVHLVSDFGRNGMPENGRWKLDGRTDLVCEPVGGHSASVALVDIGVRETDDGRLRVLAKARNWSGQDCATRVALFNGETELAQESITIAARSSRQVSFHMSTGEEASIGGRVAISDEASVAIEGDASRYFAWRRPTKQRVLAIVDDNMPGAWSPAWFLRSAVPGDADLPWLIETVSPDEAIDALADDSTKPSAVVVCDLGFKARDVARAVRDYVDAGGAALVALGTVVAEDDLSNELLAAMGARSRGPLHKRSHESQFELLSWIDFEHPVFFPSRMAPFNDYSSLRFMNRRRLAAGKDARVLARFEPDEDGGEEPAILEGDIGEGRVIVWAFGIDLTWSNLPRSAKFVPLLHETLARLAGEQTKARPWFVGDTPPGLGRLREPGLIQSELVGATFSEAVNVRAEESDPARVDPEELRLRLCAPRVEADSAGVRDIDPVAAPAGFVVRHEFWRLLVGVLLIVFILESWRAVWISRAGAGGANS